jgi:hypothetical protein
LQSATLQRGGDLAAPHAAAGQSAVRELAAHAKGKAVQVEPMKSKLKPPGTKRLKLKCDTLLSSFAFKFNLRRYTKGVKYQLTMRIYWPGEEVLSGEWQMPALERMRD